MEPEHHDLDIYPIPKEKKPLFINETTVISGGGESRRYINLDRAT